MQKAKGKKALIFARIGAVFYILWGLLHVLAAFIVLPPAIEGLEPSVTLARVQQNSFFMATIGIASVWIAIAKNWRNDRFGFWFNLFLVSAADIGFIWFVLIPGWEPISMGFIGPLLWILATSATTLGMSITTRVATPQS
jgi:hypothetical protein